MSSCCMLSLVQDVFLKIFLYILQNRGKVIESQQTDGSRLARYPGGLKPRMKQE